LTLGLDINWPTILTDDLERLTQENISLSLLEDDVVVENTIDYQIAENDKVAKELLLKLEKSKSLPTLTSIINGSSSAFTADFSLLDADQKWFGSSLFGVSLNIPNYSSGMRSASTQRAKINVEKAKTKLIEKEQNIKFEIAAAKSNYLFAVEDYENK